METEKRLQKQISKIPLIIDARGASITYGDLGGVVCSSSSLSVRDVLVCLVVH